MAERLLVVGAGTMGAQIAMQAALHGVDVALVDVNAAQLQRGVAGNRQWLERRVEKGKLDSEHAEPAAAAQSAWAIEAVVENADVKREVFAELDRALPAGAGIATNSSNIVVSRLADATQR